MVSFSERRAGQGLICVAEVRIAMIQGFSSPAFAIWFNSEKTSPNGHDDINTARDGKEQLSLPGHPVFIRSVNFAFLQDFWVCQISYGICPPKKLFWLLTSYEIIFQMDKTFALCTSKQINDNKIWLKYVDTVLIHVYLTQNSKEFRKTFQKAL